MGVWNSEMIFFRAGVQITVAAFTIFDTVLAYNKMFSTYVTLFIKFETKVCIDFKLAGF